MADTNLIKKADLATAIEVEFVSIFSENVRKLMEALGVTRKIAKQAGTALKMYKASGTLASGEDWKAKFEALQAENIAKEKQAEADRILAEKNADIEKRFAECVGDKKFSHDAIKADYLKKFAEALESEEYKGKGDVDIFHALTKDDATAFAGVTAVKLAGGTPQGNGTKYTNKADIMAIKDRTERRNAIAQNLDLFNNKGE